MPRRVGEKPKSRHFLKEWRKHRHLTQGQLAERIGTSHTNLSRIERGETGYSQGFLEAAADALGTDPASILMRDPSDPEGLWSVWDQVQPAQRRQIVEIAKALIKTAS